MQIIEKQSGTILEPLRGNDYYENIHIGCIVKMADESFYEVINIIYAEEKFVICKKIIDEELLKFAKEIYRR